MERIPRNTSLRLHPLQLLHPQRAYQWMESGESMALSTGFCLMSPLFTTRGTEMNERSRNEFIDQAQAILQGDDLLLKQAAYTALERYEIAQPQTSNIRQ